MAIDFLDGLTSDRFRQLLNVVLAVSMPVTAIIAFNTGTSFEEATRTERGTPIIEPAGYAFIIWTLIYAGSAAYAIFQAVPSQTENELFRRIGFWTASAFLGTTSWLVMARCGWIWLTVVCIIWMLASLIPTFSELVRAGSRLTTAEYWFVVFPLSVFTGWITVATFANTAAACKESGWLDFVFSEQTWTLVMIVAAGLIASFVTTISRGNAGYALTIIWALVAIAVANVMRGPNVAVAMTAIFMGALVVVALLYGRFVVSPNWPNQ